MTGPGTRARTVIDAGPHAADALQRALTAAYGAPVPEARATHEKSPAGFEKARRRLARGEPGAVGVLVRRPCDASSGAVSVERGSRPPADRALAWVRMAAATGWPADAWAVPGGAVEPGESFEAAAEREAFEETGLHVRVDRPLLLLRQAFTCGGERLPEQPFLFVGARVVDANVTLAPREADVADARWFATPPDGAFDRALVERALASWDAA